MEPGVEQDQPLIRRLALIELLERDGRVLRSVSVDRWPVTLGRALDNDVVLDDPHVAPHHATLQADAQGNVLLVVGDSINGVRQNDRLYRAGAQVTLAANAGPVQLGGVRLLLRLPGETLAPERPLAAPRGNEWLTLPAMALLLMCLALAEHWVGLDPGADATAWLPIAAGLPVALALWSVVWAMASKLFQHRFELLGHLRIVVPWLLAVEVLDAVLPPLAASLGWPWMWRLLPPTQALLLLLMLRGHLNLVLPNGRRMVTALLASAAVVGGAILVTLTHRATDRYSRPAYMSTLPIPALNVARPVATADLIRELAPLAGRLSARVKTAREDEPDDNENDAD